MCGLPAIHVVDEALKLVKRLLLTSGLLMFLSVALRKELVSGISRLVQELTTHPAVLEALQSDSVVAEKALVIGAIYAEPDFLAYSLDLPSVCSSTVSEWVVTQLPEIVQALLNGQCTLDEFVLDATHAYITL